jgi:hypothetical protein
MDVRASGGFLLVLRFTRFWPFSGWESGKCRRELGGGSETETGEGRESGEGGWVGAVYEPEPGREARVQQHGH